MTGVVLMPPTTPPLRPLERAGLAEAILVAITFERLVVKEALPGIVVALLTREVTILLLLGSTPLVEVTSVEGTTALGGATAVRVMSGLAVTVPGMRIGAATTRGVSSAAAALVVVVAAGASSGIGLATTGGCGKVPCPAGGGGTTAAGGGSLGWASSSPSSSLSFCPSFSSPDSSSPSSSRRWRRLQY